MKRRSITHIALSAAVLVMAAACTKDIAAVHTPGCGETREIVLGLSSDTIQADVVTKATAVTSLPSSLYWGATTGSGTSEAVKWASASGTVSGGRINTGKYQTNPATSYNYYVSNVAMTVGANTAVSVTNATDVIVGRLAASTSATPAVTLNHIFARTNSLTFTATGYTLSNVSCKIVSKGSLTGTKGTYNLRTGAWSSVTALTSTTLGAATWTASGASATSASDMYLIPGVYTLAITFTATKSGTSKTYTMSGDVTLVAGKRNNITATPDMTSNGLIVGWEDGGEIVIT